MKGNSIKTYGNIEYSFVIKKAPYGTPFSREAKEKNFLYNITK